MPEEGRLIPKFTECRCGNILQLTQKIIKCERCGLTYEHRPEKTICLILEIKCGNVSTSPFRLSESIIIGRDVHDEDYIKIRSRDNRMKMENTYIRNLYISREHIAIHVEDETIILSNSQEIITRKRCKVEDLGSRNGTEINDLPLRPFCQHELKHNDKIVLAPKTPLPVIITLKEEITKE